MFCCALAPWGGGREPFFVLQQQQRQAQNGAVRRGTGNRLLMPPSVPRVPRAPVTLLGSHSPGGTLSRDAL